MQPFGRNGYRPKIGCVPLWGRGSWVPIYQNVARAESYLRANFHLDSSNRLATLHERHRQDRQTELKRSDSIGRTVYKHRPNIYYYTCVKAKQMRAIFDPGKRTTLRQKLVISR